MFNLMEMWTSHLTVFRDLNRRTNSCCPNECQMGVSGLQDLPNLDCTATLVHVHCFVLMVSHQTCKITHYMGTLWFWFWLCQLLSYTTLTCHLLLNPLLNHINMHMWHAHTQNVYVIDRTLMQSFYPGHVHLNCIFRSLHTPSNTIIASANNIAAQQVKKPVQCVSHHQG